MTVQYVFKERVFPTKKMQKIIGSLQYPQRLPFPPSISEGWVSNAVSGHIIIEGGLGFYSTPSAAEMLGETETEMKALELHFYNQATVRRDLTFWD